jgi:hypothetical protein
MRRDWLVGAQRAVLSPRAAGGYCAVLVAAALYSRFDLHGWLTRDASLYLYGGQRVVAGQPPYVSMMDPKGPVSSILAGVGVAVARLFGYGDVAVVRIEFCALAVAGVLAVYLLVLELARSVLAAVVAAVVFCAFRSYAFNALVGPEGHLPGIVFLTFALWLTVRRQWYLAGIAAALAFLTWQPLFAYPIVGLVCAVAWSPERRRRAAALNLAGLATPTLALIIYYAWDGHLRALLDGLIVFPLTGVVRKSNTPVGRLRSFVGSVTHLYGPVAILFWLGLLVIVALAVRAVLASRSRLRDCVRDPFLLLLAGTLVIQLGYVCYDYIGFPHTYPLLPYAAAGIGVGVARTLARVSSAQLRWARPAVVIAMAVLAIGSLIVYSRPSPRYANLAAQQAGACAVQQSLAPGTPLWVIDDPGPLVLLRRRQPDNYPYVGSGLDTWKVGHTSGGFAGWTREIMRSHASIVVLQSWLHGRYKAPMTHWLVAHGYRPGNIGVWRVFVTRAARTQMAARSIALSGRRQIWPLLAGGGRYTLTHCPPGPAGPRRDGVAPGPSPRLPRSA